MSLDQLQPALALAAKHPDRDLSLQSLAAQAGFSPFHWHRLFCAAAGETPKQFTLRLRLDRAAGLLLSSRDSVLEIALACGFESHEAFTRAFRRRFGMPPRAYRARGFAAHTSMVEAGRHAAVGAQYSPCIRLFHCETFDHSTRNDMAYTITKRDLTPQTALVARRRVKRSEIASALGELLGGAFQYVQRAGAAMAGPPFARYLDWGPGMTTIEAGVPVAAPVAGDGAIESVTLPGGPAACTTHMGPYDRLGEAHAAVQVWIEENGYRPNGAPWESYLTDPADVPDPKDWRTDVYWPLAP